MTPSWPFFFFLAPGLLWFIVHFTVDPFISFFVVVVVVFENTVLNFHFTFICIEYSGKGDLFKPEKKK